MALRAFRIENQKAVRLAACDSVPPVMVIAGPNGVGKSTLLYALHQRVGVDIDPAGTQILYQPPHRAIRRQQVQRRWLGGALKRMADIFSDNAVSGVEGLNIPFPSRAPDNVDEAGSTLKFTLGRLENRRQTALAALVDEHSREGKAVETADLPDVFEPLRRLTSRLLPHLAFEGIDFSNEDNIRCVFTRTDVVQQDVLDLDDLSSGEKAIFLLFLPLIEGDIAARLNQLDPALTPASTEQAPGRLFLIDETEQHLHPELQARLLGYLREEVARADVQFVVTTHSPTLVDQGFDDELYLLDFPSGAGANQLKRIASNADRLEALRALTGNTFVVTTGRTIVCLEGERDPAAAPSDIRLLETLHPLATRYTFVPVGGKGNVIRVVTELRKELGEEGLGIQVKGLVDRDRAQSTVPGIVAWPVCMIENLLLHADGIASVANEHESINTDPGSVQTLIREAARAERDEEVGLRVMNALGARTIRIKGSSREDVRASLKAELTDLELADNQIDAAVDAASEEVDAALADGSFVRTFRGKALLRQVYQQLGLPNAQVSYEQFSYAIAQRLAETGAVRSVIDDVFKQLEDGDTDLVKGATAAVSAEEG